MHYRNIKKKLPPCVEGGCPFDKPTLFLSNHLAWDLYQKVCSQVIVGGMGDVLGIRFEAIEFLFDLYDIINTDERRDLFEKILAIDGVRAKIRSKELVNKQADKKKKSSRFE